MSTETVQNINPLESARSTLETTLGYLLNRAGDYDTLDEAVAAEGECPGCGWSEGHDDECPHWRIVATLNLLTRHRSAGHVCSCVGVEIGTYAAAIELPTPQRMRGRVIGCYTFRDTTCVDSCIAGEVQTLWKLGVTTTGSCCGHGKAPAYIGVVDEDIQRMESLGYRPLGNAVTFAPIGFARLRALIAEKRRTEQH